MKYDIVCKRCDTIAIIDLVGNPELLPPQYCPVCGNAVHNISYIEPELVHTSRGDLSKTELLEMIQILLQIERRKKDRSEPNPTGQ